MRHHSLIGIVLVSLIISACSTDFSEPAVLNPSPMTASTPTLLVTSLDPSATVPILNTPASSAPLFYFDPWLPSKRITADNANQVVLLAEFLGRGVGWSEDGDTLRIYRGDGVTLAYDIADPTSSPRIVEPLFDTDDLRRPEDYLEACGLLFGPISPDGKLIVGQEYTCSTIRLWDIETGEVLWSLNLTTDLIPQTEELETVGSAYYVGFNPEGTALAIGPMFGHTFYMWYFETGEILSFTPAWRIGEGSGMVTEITFSRDGTLIASTGEDGAVRIWDSITRAELLAIEAYSTRSESADFSPDNTILASGGFGPIYLWDSETGHQLISLGTEDDIVWQIKFNPQGTLLAASYETGVTRLWGILQP